NTRAVVSGGALAPLRSMVTPSDPGETPWQAALVSMRQQGKAPMARSQRGIAVVCSTPPMTLTSSTTQSGLAGVGGAVHGVGLVDGRRRWRRAVVFVGDEDHGEHAAVAQKAGVLLRVGERGVDRLELMLEAAAAGADAGHAGEGLFQRLAA